MNYIYREITYQRKQQGVKQGRNVPNSEMSTKRKPTSKQALYSSISSYADEVIQRLVELSKSKNENVALGACKNTTQ